MIRRWLRNLQGRPQTGRQPPTVAVAGALRSGTNYLKYLLEQNYEVQADFNAFGWKHAGVPVLADSSGMTYADTPLTYIVKNPYAFVVSLHRYHQRKVTDGHRISLDGAEDFDAFLTSPVTIFDSKLSASPQMRFANPVQYWNFIYWNLETLDPDRFRVAGFNYEDLISDPRTLQKIESIVHLARRTDEPAIPKNQLKRLGGEAKTEKNTGYESADDFDAAYYAEKRYLSAFTKDQLAFMRAQIDPWLMRQRGYDIL